MAAAKFTLGPNLHQSRGGSVWLDEGAELGEADTGIGLERPREGTSTEPNDGTLLP